VEIYKQLNYQVIVDLFSTYLLAYVLMWQLALFNHTKSLYSTLMYLNPRHTSIFGVDFILILVYNNNAVRLTVKK
jgi:hypothetical protein